MRTRSPRLAVSLGALLCGLLSAAEAQQPSGRVKEESPNSNNFSQVNPVWK